MQSTLIAFLGKFKNRHRKGLLMLADMLLISASYLLTWIMLTGRISLTNYRSTLLISWGIFAAVFFVVFLLFGMYESLWRYAEAYEFTKCCLASVTASLFFVIITVGVFQQQPGDLRVPYSVYFLSAFLAAMTTLFLRMFYRVYRNTVTGRKISSGARKVMLVGAGSVGNALITDLAREPNRKYDIVCAVDDDPHKQGRRIQQVKVVGTTKDIPRLAERHGVEIILLAIPGATNKQRKRITNLCAKTKCQLKKVPDLYTFVSDTGSILSQMVDVSVDDLLGRESVDLSPKKGTPFLKDKVIMVTGAGGSIGSELCRQIALQHPKRLIMVDNYENGLYEIQQELLRAPRDYVHLNAEVATVRDLPRIDALFKTYQPEIVYHAAAHKHVPLMESAPEEAVKNNIIGTRNLTACADKYKVKRFVMISTDKAVNPTNVMGASKRVCEMIIQCMNQKSKTEFVAVRFGNVLGSNGSVIPLFKEQIAAGGPVTVTHPDIIRYFMTIPEAVSLVLSAGELARGGEIFVLDMGEPTKILDLAENLIRLSGREPYKDIEIVFTGLRPGEKLFEELLMEEEGLKRTANAKIFVGQPIEIAPDSLYASLDKLEKAAEKGNAAALVKQLHDLVPTYRDGVENVGRPMVQVV